MGHEEAQPTPMELTNSFDEVFRGEWPTFAHVNGPEDEKSQKCYALVDHYWEKHGQTDPDWIWRRAPFVIGFKWFPVDQGAATEDSMQAAVKWLIKNDVYVISLKRMNFLEYYISTKHHNIDGQYATNATQNKFEKIIVDLEDLKMEYDYFKELHAALNAIAKRIPSSKLLEVEYEKLLQHPQGIMRDIQEFLSVPTVRLSTPMKKIHCADPKMCISNLEDVERTLAECTDT